MPAAPQSHGKAPASPSGRHSGDTHTRPLEEALDLVHEDRGDAYGHPAEDFALTAGMWRALFGWDVAVTDVPLAMVCVKLSRLMQSPEHRDSVVDTAGYAEAYWMVVERLRDGAREDGAHPGAPERPAEAKRRSR